ncbi:MAG: M23 family metallopeptidase [Vicinamibacterales bacterium]
MSRQSTTTVRGRATRLSDRWIYGVAPLVALHMALVLTLRARPGGVAPALWILGPPVLLIATILLLVLALESAVRRRLAWSPRRLAGLAALCALAGANVLYRTYPSSHDATPSPVDLQLPLDGPITIAWGGRTRAVNYHVISPPERWAYDLLMTVDGRSHRGDGHSLEEYYAYDRPVRAPAPGRVVAVSDGHADARPGRPEPVRRGGNTIVLEIAPGHYLVMAHLRAGSIRIQAGERVQEGDLVARVGNSGNSSEPHLHLHLQDSPQPDAGEGIPFYFSRYVVPSTGERVARGMPQGGMRGGRYVGDVIQREADAPGRDLPRTGR